MENLPCRRCGELTEEWGTRDCGQAVCSDGIACRDRRIADLEWQLKESHDENERVEKTYSETRVDALREACRVQCICCKDGVEIVLVPAPDGDIASSYPDHWKHKWVERGLQHIAICDAQKIHRLIAYHEKKDSK